MYCTVTGETKVVPLGRMRDGDLAVIDGWPSQPGLTGRVGNPVRRDGF